ncbi:MAG TPA: OsmC family protein [Candidatus Kapabacteria bacterium]|jgi:osmotically inducible protein OsmC|nr:OsmC family protein [Candidatus Kapabacteria bacterium]
MPVRSANAEWQGDLPSGKGTMKLQSGAYEGPYSFSSRFEEGTGSNPEELIAAAHAGCFSMAFSGALAKAGFVPTSVRTKANVFLDKTDAGFTITRIRLETEGVVPNIEDAQFQELAEGAKKGCPISRALGAVETIEVDARLVNA